jgi:hypothetical protein
VRDALRPAALAAILAVAALPPAQPPAAPVMRGVVVSSPRAGQIWGTHAM